MIALIIGLALCIGVGIWGMIDEEMPATAGWLIGIVVLAICCVIGSIRSVPTGSTGVVVTFGKVENYTLDSGIHFLAPWRSVKNMNNKTQIYTVELSSFSSDIQEVAIKYSINYSISKEHAQDIYKTIGEDYVATVMEPKIQEAVKGVIAKYTAEKLIEQRGVLSSQVEEILIESLAPYHINVISTSLNDIDFTDAFTNAVEAKQVAEQNKLRAKTEQEQAIIEATAAAEIQVIKAQADADSAILAAKADAEVQQIGADAAEYAGKKEAAVLSNIGEQMANYPGLEKYYYYMKWNGILPETILGGDNGLIVSP